MNNVNVNVGGNPPRDGVTRFYVKMSRGAIRETKDGTTAADVADAFFGQDGLGDGVGGGVGGDFFSSGRNPEHSKSNDDSVNNNVRGLVRVGGADETTAGRGIRRPVPLFGASASSSTSSNSFLPEDNNNNDDESRSEEARIGAVRGGHSPMLRKESRRRIFKPGQEKEDALFFE